MKKDLPMDISLFVTYLLGTLFWGLVLFEMAFATDLFCDGNRIYDKFATNTPDREAMDLMLWFFGFFSMGMPIFQAGLWIHGSETWAWTLTLGTLIMWLCLCFAAWIDS
jgi:hypothetical protein